MLLIPNVNVVLSSKLLQPQLDPSFLGEIACSPTMRLPSLSYPGLGVSGVTAAGGPKV